MRFTTTMAALAAGCLLAGCAQGTGGSDTTSDASFDPDADLTGTVEVMGFGAGDEIATVRLDRAEQELGDAKVKLVEGDLDIQQFLSSVASGQPPSLVYAERSQIGTFASRGAVVPLTDCIEGEGIDTSVFRPSALDEVTFDDQVYGIPEFNVVQITQANADLLQQSGHTLDDVNGSDWDAVLAADEDMTKQQGGNLATIGYDSKLPEFLPLWAKANGADLISEDGRTAQLDSPEVVEALEWAVSVYDAQGGFGEVKALRDSADFFGDGNQFASGTLGAMPMEQWYVNVLNDVSPDAPMAFDTVRDRQGEPLAWASGSAWAIPKGSPDPEAACRMARVMTETDSWVAAAEARVAARKKDGGLFTGVLTANEDADAQIEAMAPTDGDDVWSQAVAATYEANDHTFSMPANPAGDEFEQAWQDEVNKVLTGDKEPAEAMADAQEAAQQALDEAWASWDDK
ncbi:ABC transporter substrate-binding protein [Nocardioides zeicaulis]|uniref:ABC transporter substrate-binding protein n=1 Tax=Nocardioides zeicaulis TaxID=1776857 RepID=A0ABV6E1C3_9ACTN